MTPFERVKYNVETELDVFINLLMEKGVITNKDVRAFVRDVVIPRLATLKVIVNKIE